MLASIGLPVPPTTFSKPGILPGFACLWRHHAGQERPNIKGAVNSMTAPRLKPFVVETMGGLLSGRHQGQMIDIGLCSRQDEPFFHPSIEHGQNRIDKPWIVDMRRCFGDFHR